MKKIFLLYILAISLSISSCGFLDLESPIAVEKDKVFQDADGLRSARIGMYAGLASADYYGGTYPLTISCYSDDGANGGYSVQSFDELGNKTISSTNELIQKIWIATYNTNLIANQILANIDRIEDPSLEKAERDNIKAEALFVRALCHFDILRTWGEHWDVSSIYGIPIIRTPQAFNDAVSRSTVKQSYDFIINDLFQAETLYTNGGSSKNFVNKEAIKALIARVCLYGKDNAAALKYATDVIINGKDLSLVAAVDYAKVFTTKTSSESIFEIGFNTQNRSQYNQFTYVRPEALRPEVIFLAAADLNKFFEARKDDVRANLVDYKNVDVSVAPDGRTEKYRGEQNRDNPAYVLRVAEMYLIAAEAAGSTNGLSYINTLREKRGMAKITSTNASDFKKLILDERRAELNWEGHRFYDLARLGEVESVLGKDVKPVFPIPIREVTASGGTIIQNKGF